MGNSEMFNLKEIINAMLVKIPNSTVGKKLEKASIEKDGRKIEFDGIWESSLTDSTAKGKPDIEAVDLTSRMNTVNDIFEVTTKPMMYDADTGGKIEHFSFTVKSLERLGVSAVVIEDKIGLKKNSLFKNQTGAKQDKPNLFANKIKKICSSRQSSDFMVIARIESFILGKGLNDALNRAKT